MTRMTLGNSNDQDLNLPMVQCSNPPWAPWGMGPSLWMCVVWDRKQIHEMKEGQDNKMLPNDTTYAIFQFAKNASFCSAARGHHALLMGHRMLDRTKMKHVAGGLQMI